MGLGQCQEMYGESEACKWGALLWRRMLVVPAAVASGVRHKSFPLLSQPWLISFLLWATEAFPGPLSWKGAQEIHAHLLLLSSVAQSCPTFCDHMHRSTPGLPVHHQLLEFTQTHAHRVGDAIQPSHPLSSPSPPALSLSQHQHLTPIPSKPGCQALSWDTCSRSLPCLVWTW